MPLVRKGYGRSVPLPVSKMKALDGDNNSLLVITNNFSSGMNYDARLIGSNNAGELLYYGNNNNLYRVNPNTYTVIQQQTIGDSIQLVMPEPEIDALIIVYVASGVRNITKRSASNINTVLVNAIAYGTYFLEQSIIVENEIWGLTHAGGFVRLNKSTLTQIATYSITGGTSSFPRYYNSKVYFYNQNNRQLVEYNLDGTFSKTIGTLNAFLLSTGSNRKWGIIDGFVYDVYNNVIRKSLLDGTILWTLTHPNFSVIEEIRIVNNAIYVFTGTAIAKVDLLGNQIYYRQAMTQYLYGLYYDENKGAFLVCANNNSTYQHAIFTDKILIK